MQTSPLSRHLVAIATGSVDETASVLAPNGATHSVARLAAAESAGYERGRQAAAADSTRALVRLEQDISERHALARRQWVEHEADRLTASVAESTAVLKREFGEAIARSIVPFAMSRLRQEALDEIAAAAAELVNEAMPLAIEISGPDDLTAALRQRLEHVSTVMRVVPDGSSSELRVRVDTAVIQTRLQEWTRLLEEVLQ